MLKLKKKKYVYAQIKIDSKVIDFYLGKIENFDTWQFVTILDNKLKKYLDGNVHKFQEHKTLFGYVHSEELRLKKMVME